MLKRMRQTAIVNKWQGEDLDGGNIATFHIANKKLNPLIEVRLNGKTLSPAIDYIYDSHWQSDPGTNCHEIELTCHHKEGDKVTIKFFQENV